MTTTAVEASPTETAAQTAARPAPRTPVVIEDRATVPGWVQDVDSFRRWAKSDEFPERGRFAFLHGYVWVDLTMEQLFTHNGVKTEYTGVLRNISVEDRVGYLFSDGTLYTHPDARLSTEPDALFVFYESLKSGRARLVEGAEEGYIEEGAEEGYVEVEGAADMTLEIISATSEHKDASVLRELYWKANVSEYWLVDVRAGIDFKILRWDEKGYKEEAARDGWLHSSVFGRDFKLEQSTDPLGNPQFRLLARKSGEPTTTETKTADDADCRGC